MSVEKQKKEALVNFLRWMKEQRPKSGMGLAGQILDAAPSLMEKVKTDHTLRTMVQKAKGGPQGKADNIMVMVILPDDDHNEVITCYGMESWSVETWSKVYRQNNPEHKSGGASMWPLFKYVPSEDSFGLVDYNKPIRLDWIVI